VRHLGDHRFLGFFSTRDSRSWRQRNIPLVAGQPSFITDPAAATNLQADQRRLTLRYYLDTVADPATQGRYAMEALPGGPFGPWELRDANGNPFTVYMMGHPAGSFDVPELERRRVISRILGDTVTLLGGRLVATAGWREDRARTRGARAEDRVPNPATNMYVSAEDAAFAADWDRFTGGEKMSYGAVVHPFDSRIVSFHYNQSGNYQPPSRFLDHFNRLLPGSNGRGKDFGVRTSLFQGRLTARLNFFRNELNDITFQGRVQNVIRAGYDVQRRMEVLHPDMPRGEGMNGNQSRVTYSGKVDSESEGMELELVATPLPNWRVFLTVGRQESVQTNVAPDFNLWYEERLPVWQAYSGWTTQRITGGTSEIIRDFFETNVRNAYLYSLVATNGQAADNMREWRANLISNYTLRKGPLKGLTVGGTARWRSSAIIGYGATTTTLSNGQTRQYPDTTIVHRGPEELFFDGLVRYSRKLTKRMTWDVQLNVRNLLDDDDPTPSAAYTSGLIQRYTRVAPRTWVASSSLEF
jgi:hypothetical protein